MKKQLLSIITGSLLIGAIPSANAAVVDVSKIIITSANTNANDAYIQIQELIATDTLGNDVALASLGATAYTNRQYSSAATWGPQHSIDGLVPGTGAAGTYFHSDRQADAYLEITLGSISSLESISIYGRAGNDAYYNNTRDIYNIELFDDSGTLLFSASGLNANNPEDLAFLQLPVSAVPEPSTWALMLGGLGIIGFFARRRQA